MKMPKRLSSLPLLSLPWLSLVWRRREDRKPQDFPPHSVDAEEFARLIGSGRVEDLRILARKLSEQPKADA